MTNQQIKLMSIIARPYEETSTKEEYEFVKNYEFDKENEEDYCLSLTTATWLFFQEILQEC